MGTAKALAKLVAWSTIYQQCCLCLELMKNVYTFCMQPQPLQCYQPPATRRNLQGSSQSHGQPAAKATIRRAKLHTVCACGKIKALTCRAAVLQVCEYIGTNIATRLLSQKPWLIYKDNKSDYSRTNVCRGVLDCMILYNWHWLV